MVVLGRGASHARGTPAASYAGLVLETQQDHFERKSPDMMVVCKTQVPQESVSLIVVFEPVACDMVPTIRSLAPPTFATCTHSGIHVEVAMAPTPPATRCELYPNPFLRHHPTG